ncbi:2-succinyl-5-enolpyruvyl-6-hydroxy-3-cyclohexene-1-carboxylic-acid synthase [Erwinia sp. P6884]|uniref:2-succinyl-5-enolpyruvyl-6-hydroxy-3- cyclohexene-1-carboxylic-acid synthase n=1 Tax=Erwinia sp. P6884 TaxID=3141450 RepID=UPI00319A7377
MSRSTFNRRWAGVILEALTRHGVRHLCIAPGSRSAPLTLAAAAHPRLVCHTHFDERGLGHLALGLAKATRQPVAVIVTSGTAVANLYPAVIEAKLTGERLIMLSADRPPELIDCGASQAIEQPGIFAGHAAALNLPRPSPAISARWLVTAVDALLGQHPFGAVHLNCPFAEPLYGGDPDAYQSWQEELGSWWQETQPWLQYEAGAAVSVREAWTGLRLKHGVIVVGKVTPEEGRAIAAWADALGWPLLADVQSHTGQPLPCAEIWLRKPQARQALSQAEMVVQFGSHLTGKQLNHWLTNHHPETWWLIEAMPGRRDPAHHRSCRIQADISRWLAAHPAGECVPWRSQIIRFAAETREESMMNPPPFGEALLAQRLSAFLPAGGALFLGNSLTVRLVDALCQLPAGYPVYASRGASGIDGLIATAAGVQRGSGQPLLLILGDISALYDLNSLALLRQVSAPVIAIVINNNGGQIFSLLPTPEEARERFFAMPQHIHFASAASMFGLRYACPESWDDLCVAVERGWQGPATLIELRVADDDGARFLAQAGKQ